MITRERSFYTIGILLYLFLRTALIVYLKLEVIKQPINLS